ncbi:zinc dependent phospholipase C family protein [Pontibacter chitinilyticus]|uniref:zinc dependent phospholipase C family protein n=1 Tax=Pontibacter chitinilyticus TaxID=2674989 RepID=UPI00321C1D5E
MKNFRSKTIVLTALLVLSAVSGLFAWGAWGHQHINRAAVFVLPAPMRTFFYNHLDFVTEEAVVPDLRKYTINDKPEFARHFIDLEAYGEHPLRDLPKTMPELMEQYDSTTLQKNGILPWYIEAMTAKLTQAFKAKRKAEILFIAADLGHYIADAHMPLHTSINHDGQATNQRGIHAFWESQLPELFGDTYNLHTRNANYIDDIPGHTWDIVAHSHGLADSLLRAELQLKNSYPEGQLYAIDSVGAVAKNKFGQPVHSTAYATAYHQRLKGMVERQMRLAVVETANYWYTAWVNAGKPDLTELDPESLTKRNKENLKKDLKLWEKEGKVTGVKSEAEF